MFLEATSSKGLAPGAGRGVRSNVDMSGGALW